MKNFKFYESIFSYFAKCVCLKTLREYKLFNVSMAKIHAVHPVSLYKYAQYSLLNCMQNTSSSSMIDLSHCQAYMNDFGTKVWYYLVLVLTDLTGLLFLHVIDLPHCQAFNLCWIIWGLVRTQLSHLLSSTIVVHQLLSLFVCLVREATALNISLQEWQVTISHQQASPWRRSVSRWCKTRHFVLTRGRKTAHGTKNSMVVTVATVGLNNLDGRFCSVLFSSN